MLVFVGLGLAKDGLSLRGLKEVKDADKVYAEFYTSLIPEFDLDDINKEIGGSVEVLNRSSVEENPDPILEDATNNKVVFLVVGDPMVATTHVDLRMRAEKKGIETRVIHGASIETAASGLAGLQSYKFGRAATIPFPEKPSETPYEVLEDNQNSGLHTLFLLDIEMDEERFLTANSAIKHLLDVEVKLGRGIFTEDTLCVVVARAGTSNPVVEADRAEVLKDRDFGAPPHVLIVPGGLHFLEAEALERFAEAPSEVVEKHAEG